MSESTDRRASSGRAPRDTLEVSLLDIWRRVFKLPEMGVGDNLFEWGVDSLRAAKMLVDVQHRLGARLPISLLLEAPTVEALAAVIRKADDGALWRSVVPLRAAGSKTPLFLVHPARGSVLVYRRLAELLDAQQPVYALQPQGGDGRTAMRTRIPDIAAHFVEGIREVRPNGPYNVAGFSFGGLVAWEIAQQFRAQGEEVPLLALLDTQRPSLRRFFERHLTAMRAQPPLDGLRYLADKAVSRARQEWAGLRMALFGRASDRGEEPPAPTEIHLRSSHATRRYRPRPYPARVALVQTTPTREVDWRPLVGGHLDVRTIDCDHVDLLASPYLDEVAHFLRAALGN